MTPSPFRSPTHRLLRAADQSFATMLDADKAVVRLVGPRRIGKTDLVSAYARQHRVPVLNCAIRPLLADAAPASVLTDLLRAEIDSLTHTAPKLHRAYLALARKEHPAAKRGILGLEVAAGPLRAVAATQQDRAAPAPTIPSITSQLRRLNLAAEKVGLRPIVFLDEVQELIVGHLETAGMAALWEMRNEIQHHTACRYVFAGSNQRVFAALHTGKAAPLLNLGTALELPPLTQAEIDTWAIPHFTRGRRHVRTLAPACRLLCGKIGEVVEVCDWLWTNTAPEGVLDDTLQQQAVVAVAGGQAPIELAARSLSPAQATLLRWILSNPGVTPYHRGVGLNAGTVRNALIALVESGLLESWGGSTYLVASPLRTLLTITPDLRLPNPPAT